MRATRDIIRRFEASVVGPWMAEGWDAVQAHWPHPDSVEGPQAFFERRDADWSS